MTELMVMTTWMRTSMIDAMNSLDFHFRFRRDLSLEILCKIP
jgi:hypothetical protein